MFQLNYLITREHSDEVENFGIFVQESYFLKASLFQRKQFLLKINMHRFQNGFRPGKMTKQYTTLIHCNTTQV
jgi:hypothetical protein